ncbi:hypothetical protein [Sphingobacterium hotanense]|uniref:hypothetical protein n=1 Tax=Sphingobacterium hotanense TaxID=649196 RepID=UPI0021A3555E|nr:hypothetical protein [Sphingobacterium hotanense]MCT1524693.1 hypothetical protein [Sphingobacterium hotanense]
MIRYKIDVFEALDISMRAKQDMDRQQTSAACNVSASGQQWLNYAPLLYIINIRTLLISIAYYSVDCLENMLDVFLVN